MGIGVRYSEFEDQFLVACYEKTNSTEGKISTGDVLDDFPLDYRRGWILKALEEFNARNFVNYSSNTGSELQQRVIITAAGLKEAEKLIDEGVNFSESTDNEAAPVSSENEMPDGLLEAGRTFISSGDVPQDFGKDGDVLFEVQGETTKKNSKTSIESVNWTGVQTRLEAKPAVVEHIREKISELDALVDQAGLTNTENAKAKSITKALVSLIESPEPEWKAIAELLNSPVFSAVLNMAAMAQLILGIML